jgi:hypothetical protein
MRCPVPVGYAAMINLIFVRRDPANAADRAFRNRTRSNPGLKLAPCESAQVGCSHDVPSGAFQAG